MQDLERYQAHTAEEPISIIRQDPDRGFLKLIGLSPAAATIAIVIDVALAGEDIVSGGLLIPFSLAGAALVGYVTFCLQKKWGDDRETARVKGLIIGFLTAVPFFPVTVLLAAPQGLAGLIRNAVRRHE